MLRRMLRSGLVAILLLAFLFPSALQAYAQSSPHKNAFAADDFPAVEPDYIYDQLFLMSTQFLKRESGYDDKLPPTVNGHDEFADYWSQEMLKNLQGFGAQVRRDPFKVTGWADRPAPLPGFNIEVSIPGVLHPEQIVVIGCHYDGMGNSQGSAFDDASGCAIELGVAKALGNYWRSHHMYPARTLRFVIFDAEEQGLIGSFHYVNETLNGDLSNVVAMFNEEQNGIAYPLRYLGRLSNPLMPLYIEVSPTTSNGLYEHQDQLTPKQRNQITNFRTLMEAAAQPVFAKFQALGYLGLTYHDEFNQNVPQPIFSPDQVNNLHVEDDNLGSSDQMPFTLAGLPCATIVSNSTYYNPNPIPGSFPFDQHEDTIELMNTYANGNSARSNALALALAIPGMITTWALNQPDVLGFVADNALPSGPAASISDIGLVQVGKDVTLDAHAAFDPKDSNASLTYNWDFGDGSNKDTGADVKHIYTTAGSYQLTLTVSSPSGTTHMSKTVTATTAPTLYPSPYQRFDGRVPETNPHNPQVVYPVPDARLSDKVIHTPSELAATTSVARSTTGSLPTGISITVWAIVIVVLALLIGGFVFMRKRKQQT